MYARLLRLPSPISGSPLVLRRALATEAAASATNAAAAAGKCPITGAGSETAKPALKSLKELPTPKPYDNFKQFLVYQYLTLFKNIPKGSCLAHILDDRFYKTPFRSDLYPYFKWANEHGPMIYYSLAGEHTVMVSTPELFKEVFTNPAFYGRPPTPYFAYAVGIYTGKPGTLSIVQRNGDDWAKHRRIANKALIHPRMVEGFTPTLNEHALKLTDKWAEMAAKADGVVEVNNSLKHMAMAIIGRVGFGEDFEKHPEVLNAVQCFFDGAGEMFMSLPPYPETPAKIKLDKALGFLKTYGHDLLARRRKEIAEGKVGDDFLSQIASTKDDETGELLPDEEVLADTLDVMNGGTDTTAALLAFACHVLGTHPEVQEKLYNDVAKEAGTDPRAEVTYEQINNMPYLANFVKEVLRRFPSAPLNGRGAVTDTAINGYLVPKGTTVVVNTWHVHLNPKYWPEPLKFDPDRHSQATRTDPFAWLPFGSGGRVCLGMRLSLLESKVALAHMVRRFRLDALSKEEPRQLNAITMRSADPINVKLTARH